MKPTSIRLINVGTLEFRVFPPNKVKPYIVASHRWTDREATFVNFRWHKEYRTPGFRKVARFCDCIQDLRPDIEWLWIDTCCIDKSDAVEVSKSIRSMFRWYQNAAECFAYLADVPTNEHQALTTSEWFQRGWTLQELLAPSVVVFLDSKWSVIGHKRGRMDQATSSAAKFYRERPLNNIVSRITGIPEDVLWDVSAVRKHGVPEIDSWARRRVTREPEDKVYCMLGLLGVEIPPRYHEGEAKARRRLLDALVKKGRAALSSASGSSSDGNSTRNAQGSRHIALPPQGFSIPMPGSNAMSERNKNIASFNGRLIRRRFNDARTKEPFQYAMTTTGELVQVFGNGRTVSRGPVTADILTRLRQIFRDDYDDNDEDGNDDTALGYEYDEDIEDDDDEDDEDIEDDDDEDDEDIEDDDDEDDKDEDNDDESPPSLCPPSSASAPRATRAPTRACANDSDEEDEEDSPPSSSAFASRATLDPTRASDEYDEEREEDDYDRPRPPSASASRATHAPARISAAGANRATTAHSSSGMTASSNSGRPPRPDTGRPTGPQGRTRLPVRASDHSGQTLRGTQRGAQAAGQARR